MLARNKCKILHYENVWQAKTTEEINTVALCTKLKKIKDSNLKLVHGIVNKGKHNKTPKNNKKQKKDKQNNEGNSPNRKDKWIWKKTTPKEGEDTTKDTNGKITIHANITLSGGPMILKHP